jgi:antitoxin Phd
MESNMITFTSVEAQNRFGELIDRSQREPVEVTRRGRTVAYVISEHDMRELVDLRKRREAASRWYSQYRSQVAAQAQGDAPALTDADVNRLVHELR